MGSYPEKEPIASSSEEEDDETPQERRYRRMIQKTAIESYEQGKRDRNEATRDEVAPTVPATSSTDDQMYDERLSLTALLFGKTPLIVLTFGVLFCFINAGNYVFSELTERITDFTLRQYTDVAAAYCNVTLGIVLSAIIAVRWYLWHGTRLVRLGDELAYLSPRLLPFMAKSKKVVKFSSIDTLNVDQGVLEALFRLNSWKVYIDTPSDEHKVFRNLRGVKDAETLRSIWGNSS